MIEPAVGVGAVTSQVQAWAESDLFDERREARVD